MSTWTRRCDTITVRDHEYTLRTIWKNETQMSVLVTGYDFLLRGLQVIFPITYDPEMVRPFIEERINTKQERDAKEALVKEREGRLNEIMDRIKTVLADRGIRMAVYDQVEDYTSIRFEVDGEELLSGDEYGYLDLDMFK